MGRKPSLTIARTALWRDYNFSIRAGILYKAEYLAGGKISQPESVLNLSDCIACKMYRDTERSHTFLLTTSKPNVALSKILPVKAGSKLSSSVTYCFSARNERDATEWVYNIKKLLPSSNSQKAKGRIIPVKAGALVWTIS